MKPGTRALASTAALLAVAAAAVAGAWFGIARPDRAARTRKDADAKLYAFSAPQVTAVTVQAKGETTRVVRAGEGWRVESPVQAEAERATVEALVERVAALRRKASVVAAPDPEALARYGLARPRATVSLTLEGGRAETLALGDENPFDGSAFVRTTGGAVELVPGDVKWTLERGTLDLREKRLLPFEESALQRVEVSAPGTSYALARGGEAGRAGWRLEAPVRERADDAAVGRVLGAIRGLRATAFVATPQPDRAYGLDRPRFTVRVVTGGPPRTLQLGEGPARPGESGSRSLYGRLEGSREVAVLAAGAAEDLAQDLASLRDKTVLRFERDQVAAIRFTRGGSPFEVSRVAAPSRVAGYAWTLSSLRGRALVGEGAGAQAQHGLDHPALEVSLLAADGKELDRLLVSPERGGKTYASAASSRRVFELEPAPLATLPRSAEDAQEKPATSVEAKAAPDRTPN